MLWQGCDRFAPHPGRARRRALYPEAGKQVAWLCSRRSAVSALLPATAHSMAKDITPLSPDRRPAGRLPAPGSGLAAIYSRRAGAAQVHTPADWERAFSAVRNRKWLVAGVVLFGTAAGAVGARFLKPTYQARATVWLALRDPVARRAGFRGPPLASVPQAEVRHRQRGARDVHRRGRCPAWALPDGRGPRHTRLPSAGCRRQGRAAAGDGGGLDRPGVRVRLGAP